MDGERLDGAKAALSALVDRLDPADQFGLVTFDDEVNVEIATAPMLDKNAAKRRIAGVRSGGMTNLSAGYLRGLQEARRAKTAAGGAVLLISDGHANVARRTLAGGRCNCRDHHGDCDCCDWHDGGDGYAGGGAGRRAATHGSRGAAAQ